MELNRVKTARFFCLEIYSSSVDFKHGFTAENRSLKVDLTLADTTSRLPGFSVCTEPQIVHDT